MREIQYIFVRAVIVSLAFTVCARTLSAEPFYMALGEMVQRQSDDGTFSFGEGRFEIDGKVPKGFTEFKYLYLEGGSFKLAPDKKRMVADSPANLQGELYGRLKFKLKKAILEGDAITFETQTARGIGFQFDGTIFNATTEKDQPASIGLKGRLSKWMNGKKVAEAQVTFGYLEPED